LLRLDESRQVVSAGAVQLGRQQQSETYVLSGFLQECCGQS
jgi:hypothetical protein